MEQTQTLRCYTCREDLDVAKFSLARTTKRGYQTSCKTCTKKMQEPHRQKAVERTKTWREKNPEKVKEQWRAQYHQNKPKYKNRALQYNFGITLSDYEVMMKEQDGCCALCGVSQEEHSRAFAVDHCHSSGKIRRLLCNSCNTGLGLFKDNPELLRKAAVYLEEHKDG